MLRICVIVFVMVGVAFADQDKPTSQPKPAAPAKSSSLGTQNSIAKPGPGTSPVTAVVKQGNPPPEHANEAKDDENMRIQRGLVIVGFLQALILAVTVGALARQTSVARNTERAWIMASPVPSAPGLGFIPEQGDPVGVGAQPTNIFICSLKNTGETPARLIDSTVSYRMVPRLEDIPKEPQYDEKGVMNDFLLVKGDSIGAYAPLQPQMSLTKAQAQSIFNRQAFLYAFGVVNYRDVFDRRHETRFGYLYFFPQGGDPRPAGFQRTIEIPPSYNRAT